MGVQVGDAVSFRKLFQIPGGALGVHWLRAGLFCEHVSAEAFLRLFYTKLVKRGIRSFGSLCPSRGNTSLRHGLERIPIP